MLWFSSYVIVFEFFFLNSKEEEEEEKKDSTDPRRLDVKEGGVRTRNWIASAQDRSFWRALVNTTLNLRVP